SNASNARSSDATAASATSAANPERTRPTTSSPTPAADRPQRRTSKRSTTTPSRGATDGAAPRRSSSGVPSRTPTTPPAASTGDLAVQVPDARPCSALPDLSAHRHGGALGRPDGGRPAVPALRPHRQAPATRTRRGGGGPLRHPPRS